MDENEQQNPANEVSASPDEIPGREDYYEVALIHTTFFCKSCAASLDPDQDLGPDLSFHSDYYWVHLGDAAFDRGWRVSWDAGIGEFEILCPGCAGHPRDE